MKKIIALFICLVLLVGVFAACGSPAEPAQPAQPAEPAEPADPAEPAEPAEPGDGEEFEFAGTIRFGAALPITGALSPEGIKQQNGYDLWAYMVNNSGGIQVGDRRYLVEMVYMDYQSDTATAVRLAENLITEQDVSFLFGPFGSGAARAVSAVTEMYQIPMVAPTASAVSVFEDGNEFIFGMFTPDRTLTEPLATLAMAQDDPPQTIAVIARNDLFPLSIANEAQVSAEERGIEVVVFDQFSAGVTDFAPILIQVANADPCWVFVTGYANDLIMVRRQMAELGIEPKMLTMIAGAAYMEFIDGLGDLAENVTAAVWWHDAVRYVGDDVFGTAENFARLYEERFGYIPDYVIASAAAVGVVFQNAIERAGTLDPIAVRDALAASDFISFFGPIRFDERGMQTALEPPILQIMNGRHVPLHPSSIQEADLVYPMYPR